MLSGLKYLGLFGRKERALSMAFQVKKAKEYCQSMPKSFLNIWWDARKKRFFWTWSIDKWLVSDCFIVQRSHLLCPNLTTSSLLFYCLRLMGKFYSKPTQNIVFEHGCRGKVESLVPNWHEKKFLKVWLDLNFSYVKLLKK